MSTASSGPVSVADRITSLDAVRGVAVLGILTMNVVSYGLLPAAYFNIEAANPQAWFDWVVGAAGEVFFDQKFMGLFSMLFGAGIVLFADRAAAKGRHPLALSLWRNFLLFLIGVAHLVVWEGDILTVYALCAPVLLWARRLETRTLLVLGCGVITATLVGAVVAQASVGTDGAGLGDYWYATGEVNDTVGLWLIGDFFGRALGMMLIGVAAYRTGFLTGAWPTASYVRVVRWGLGGGLALAAAGFAWVAASGFDASVAVIGSMPNTVATPFVVAGYTGAIILWHRRAAGRPLDLRIRAAGRMALTNYLTQSILGVLVLRVLVDSNDLGRGALALFVVAVWILQLWWSQAWLRSHRYGPAEWLWRVATYGRIPR